MPWRRRVICMEIELNWFFSADRQILSKIDWVLLLFAGCISGHGFHGSEFHSANKLLGETNQHKETHFLHEIAFHSWTEYRIFQTFYLPY
jgi:hypothetical protein